jgi:leader peptidase (prepilin peptidase)/N-methyltransferase
MAVPFDQPPRNDCPHCGQTLPGGWRGWLRLAGRCPACRMPLMAHRWAFPAITAAGCAALAWRLPVHDRAEILMLVAWLLLAVVGVVLAGIDLRVNRLPLPLLAVAAALVSPLVALAAASGPGPWLLLHAVVTAAAFGGVYLILALAGPGLVGAGDVYLAALLGLLLGTGPMTGIWAGAVLPYLLAFPVTAVRLSLGYLERRGQIALGPYLIGGAILARALIP